MLECLNLPLLELPGYEADDIIATLCATLAQQDCDLVVVSSDKDFMQLVTDESSFSTAPRNRWIGTVDVHARSSASVRIKSSKSWV